jgi:nucleoside-diphosphate-sugar epimerase
MAVKVFVAGATGAIGRRLVPLLVASGYDVVGMTRSGEGVPALRAVGAVPVVVDGLDRAEVMHAVEAAQPDVIVHEMTGLSAMASFRHFDEGLALTNRLRTEGTANLLAAAQAVGARRFVAQSYGNGVYARTGPSVHSEDDPIDPDPPEKGRSTLEAIRRLEAAVLGTPGVEGICLRYGNFYGPGTAFAHDGAFVELIRKRRLPIVGDGGGVWSFVHIDDAATATVAAVERGAPGVYNICDDEPVRVSVWLPELARVLGARPPWHVPLWLGRLFVGEVGVSFMTRIRGASNAKARRELGWHPRWRTWAEGFRGGLGDVPLPSLAA